MTEFAPMSWQYIAGFFDGEGCIYRATRNGKQLGHFRLTMTQTSSEVLTRIAQFLEDKYIKTRTSMVKRNGNRSECYTLIIDNIGNILPFLNNTVPYLIVKRSKAMEAISILNDYQNLNSRDKTTRSKSALLILRNNGLTYKEISKYTGISVGAIWRVVHAK